MDFRTATDRLTACQTHRDIGEAAGVSEAGIRAARLDPESASYRQPPSNWKAVVAKLARERAAELERLAGELEGAAE